MKSEGDGGENLAGRQKRAWYNSGQMGIQGMEYSINFVNMARELPDGHYRANVVFTFTISNGLVNTHGDVVLTDGGMEIIEQRGKDRDSRENRFGKGSSNKDETHFETQIFLNVPYGHAEYFSKKKMEITKRCQR